MRKFFLFCIALASSFVFVTTAFAQEGNGSVGDTRLTMWNAIAGFLTPLVMGIILQSSWAKRVQAVVTFAFAVVLSIITTALEGGLNFEDWITSMLVVFVAAIGSYYGLWKPSGIAGKIKAKTDLKRAA